MTSLPARATQSDLDDIAQTLAYLHPPRNVFEVCLINPQVKKHRLWNGFAGGQKAIVAGWFDDVGKAADVIRQINDQVEPDGIYVTLNPCNPALLGRANNRLKASVARTKDRDVDSIRHLLIDMDPERPAGVSSTETEKEATSDMLRAVYGYLKGQSWPKPLAGDSGNGGHLIYCLDLENNQKNVELVKAVLQALDKRFSTEQVKVDTSVFNPARISKVYGTTARKGDSTNDRPHRKAAILSIPAEAHPVPVELLQKLAGEVEPVPTHRPATTPHTEGPRLDVERYLNKYGVPLKKVKPHGSSTLYILETCLFDETHTGGEAAIGQTAEGKIFYQCFHDSCQGRTWHDARKLISGDDKLFERTLPSNSTATGGKAFEWPEMIPLPEQGATGQAADYDLELLPEAIREAAAEVARFVKVPVMSPAVAGLSCIATAIGKKAVVIERPGLEHHPALFFAMIAASGERKSPVFQNMARPLEQWVFDLIDFHEEKRREEKANNMAIDSAIAGVKGKAKKENADLEAITKDIAVLEAKRIKEPPYPSLFTTDTTEQRLFQKMHDRNGSYAVMSGEGRPVFDAIMGKYSGDGRTGDAIYLAGISGDTITRDRVGSEAGPEERIIYQPCLNVCVFVQPDKYQEAASHPALRASGALARIWPVWLPSLVGTRLETKNEQGLNLLVMKRFNDLVNQLLQVKPPKDEITGIEYHRARLSTEATEARREFHNIIEQLMNEGQDLEDVRDIASKAVSQTAKLALVLHLAAEPVLLSQAESTISLDTWARAQALGTYHLQEAVRVQRMAEEDKSTHQARRLLEWIKRGNLRKVTARQISQFGPRPRLKAEQARDQLDMLVDFGYLRRQKVEGKTKPIYIVNPALFVDVVDVVDWGHHEK